LILLNLKEAEYVRNYILKGGDRQAFLDKFQNAYSEGFDPDTDLDRVGVANQTTMLKTETEQMGKLFEQTMLEKFGPTELDNHFMSFNTICDATQERQDAMFDLVKENLDLMVVIGGFNSSNTTHLQEIAVENNIPSYHIDSGDRLLEHNLIEHKPLDEDITTQTNWLPEGKLKIGITSGASTPDKVVEEVIAYIFNAKAKTAAVV
jgi:4-hydroxy-3-methylbut-2-enyl diphosphate reductase